VDPLLASHKLSIYKEARYISQKKCKFGEERRLAAKVEADKLLNAGFIEEQRLIGNPTTIKEVQRLIGRLTAISRFLPKLAKQTQPIVQLLKKSTRFTWTDDCGQIFQKLKTTLTSPPILHKPDTR